jgi:phosphatidylglycerophosphatase A
MTSFSFCYQDQTKQGIIDDVYKVGINTFTDDGFAIVG